ncbi:MAG TPA: signal recognition particle-docking protein FtsY [Chromatiales bacterium]|nr:signal recognition particle-docking protein FtsY [Thiotrichales bacterium]HIP67176.1 signal recognition particle-docking protein FtsY [Chromatiales bacterium]
MIGFKKNLQTPEKSSGIFGRLRDGLSKTSHALTDGMGSMMLGHKTLDDDLLEEIETRLLTADVGVEATNKIIQDLTQRVSRKELANVEALYQALGESMYAILEPCEQPLRIDTGKKPFAILVTGINGAGKTTTIGKLAHHFKAEGYSVMLAAGDTFRAAAVEQLQEWGKRNDVPVISQGTGADSASVVFDALQSAKARGIDILIADTAGRLHTQDNLMDELKKIKRVMGKMDETAPHETLLVVDGGTGQNALRQAEAFNDVIKLDGLVVTKLDGTAKGGVMFALAEKLHLPIRYIGVGEAIEDLRTFDAEDFINAILQGD